MNPFRSPKVAGRVFLVAFTAVVVVLVACEPPGLASRSLTEPPTEPVVVEAADAAALLAQLVVTEEDTGAHYDRDKWHTDWAYHGDGCSTPPNTQL